MKIDFHTHGKLAKNLPFSPEYTHWLFSEARLAGLDAICLTEHFNTLGFTQLYEYILKTFTKTGDCFCCENLKIFPGMEIDVAEGGHVLVIGTMEDILKLHAGLLPYSEKGHFMSLKKLLEVVRGYPVLFGAAHPFRKGGNIPKLPEVLIREFDFIDLNGKDVAENGESAKSQVRSLSSRLMLPIVAGSDTHQSTQYGSIYNDFETEIFTVNALDKIMKEGAYTIHTSPNAYFQVKTAGVLKKALKEIHALGGDYVSILKG